MPEPGRPRRPPARATPERNARRQTVKHRRIDRISHNLTMVSMYVERIKKSAHRMIRDGTLEKKRAALRGELIDARNLLRVCIHDKNALQRNHAMPAQPHAPIDAFEQLEKQITRIERMLGTPQEAN